MKVSFIAAFTLAPSMPVDRRGFLLFSIMCHYGVLLLTLNKRFIPKYPGFETPKIECATAFGLEFPNKIPNSAFSATSTSWAPYQARLRNKKSGGNCWRPQYNNAEQWIQVDLGDIVKITRIATQGRQDAAYYVKSYSLSYSVNCGTFQPYRNYEVRSAYRVLELIDRRKLIKMWSRLFGGLPLRVQFLVVLFI